MGLKCLPKVELGCVGQSGTIFQVLKLVVCALSQLKPVLGKVSDLIENVKNNVVIPEQELTLLNAVMATVYIALGKVSELLCLHFAVLMSLVLTLAPGVFMVLAMTAVGLSVGIPLLGAVLGGVVLTVDVLLFAVLVLVSGLVLLVVMLLETLLLVWLVPVLISLLYLALGIPVCGISGEQCGNIVDLMNVEDLKGFVTAIANLLKDKPMENLRCLTSFFVGLLTEQIPAPGFLAGLVSGLVGGLVNPLVQMLAPVVDNILSFVSLLIDSIASSLPETA